MARAVLAFLWLLAALAVGMPAASAGTSAAAGVAGDELTVEPGPGVTLSVDGRRYAGEVVIARDGSAGIDVVNRVGFEQYVEGIGEMPSNWPAAALQAQAVAARTYALWSVLTHQPGPGGGRICSSDACQVYSGLSKAEGPSGANWVAAVRATSGLVLQYQGRIIEALYGSSDGGQTLYGGVPWLPSVADPQDSMAPEHQWSWTAPLTQMAAVLQVPAGETLVSLVSSARAITETLKGADGSTSTVALAPDSFHSLINSAMPPPAGLDLPLPSYRYSVSTYGDQVKIAGWGDGNGLGLSQYGALGKALAGWSAGQILGNYYRGASASTLPAGEMPATISVTLATAAAGASVGATGPIRILDSAGRPLAGTVGPGGWHATTAGGGVALVPAGGVNAVPVPSPGSDTAPAPQRGPAPASPAAQAPAPPTTRATAPTTTAAPATTRPSPDAVRAVALGAAEAAPPVRPSKGGGFWRPLAVVLLLLVATGLFRTARFGGALRSKRLSRPAKR